MKVIIVAMMLLILIAACSGGGSTTTGADNAALDSVAISSGNSQSATVGMELPIALNAILLDKEGLPIAGFVVNFKVVVGGGSVFAGSAISDQNGIVRERWTLGSIAGPQKVEVRAVDVNGSAVVYATFDATAVAGAHDSASIVSGDFQSAVQLQPLSQPVKLVVKDKYGNPTAGVTVTFQANNGGTAFPQSTTTNISGEASSEWTLGAVLGTQTLDAVIAGLSPLRFSSTANQAPPTAAVTITKISGDLQTIDQHKPPSPGLTVRVTDVLGNGVPGASVVFSAVPESGYVKPATLTTGADGTASFVGFFHVSGQLQILASAVEIPPVMFTVNVTPNTHLFDGEYVGGLHFVVSNGLIPYSAFETYGTVNENDGTVSVTTSGNTGYNCTGQIILDSLQNSTASGTCKHKDYVFGTGTVSWASERK